MWTGCDPCVRAHAYASSSICTIPNKTWTLMKTLLYSTTSGQKLHRVALSSVGWSKVWLHRMSLQWVTCWEAGLIICAKIKSGVFPSFLNTPKFVTLFLALIEQSNTHMLLLISAKSRLQLCHWEFPFLQVLTETQSLTDEAQPAPVCETPPLSLALCLTTSALH